jgi:hypothetical protein
MKERTGEKVGWAGGWLGSFLWVLALGIVFLVQGKTGKGLAGLALFVLAVFFVFMFAPWRRPDTPYWELMLPMYFLFFSSAAWAIRAFGGWRFAGLSWWNVFWVLPMLMPLGSAGRRTWNQSAERKEP